MPAEGRNGWLPSGYTKKTRTGINQQVPHAHSSRAVVRRGARSGPDLWWACGAAEGRGEAGACHGTVSLDELSERGYHGGAEQDELAERYEAEDLRMRVRSAMTCLPPRQREVLERYYGQSLTLREAGLRMGISEARACQLHGRAIQNLRRQLSVAFPSHGAASRVLVAA